MNDFVYLNDKMTQYIHNIGSDDTNHTFYSEVKSNFFYYNK